MFLRGVLVGWFSLLMGIAAVGLFAKAFSWQECDGPVWMTATISSYHFDRPNNYRERHAGIGFEHVCGDWRGVGGVIPQNSKDHTSLYVGAARTLANWRELHLGVFGGLFTGYSRPILPAGAFIGAWEGRRYGVNLLWFPPYEDHKGLLVLQLKSRF